MKLSYCFLVIFVASSLFAQTATLRGTVTDETGAIVPQSKVTLSGPGGLVKTTTAGDDGTYSFAGLAPGNYTVQASAPDLAQQPVKTALKQGVQTLNLQLKVASTVQQVTVQENAGPALGTDPTSNTNALILRGEDLQALSDDPEDLAADLQALAGPSAGPSGGSIYVDGFSGGELPPKDSIREIRINQNPFSPEFDKLGFGRIEIFTKPGTDKFHGTAFYNFGDAFWNSRNPYAGVKAPFLLNEFGGNLSGPINKRASFFLDLRRDMVDNGSIINAVTLDPQTLLINPFSGTLTTPQRRFTITPRVDYQLNDKNTLTMRYLTTRADVQNAGIGGFDLTSRGYHIESLSQTVQATETAVLGAAVNETRFQFYRTSSQQIANSTSPAIEVLGSFNGGGAQIGHTFNTQNYFELQNYTTIVKGAHTWKFGARVRGQTYDSVSPQNFGGTYTFGGGIAPELDANNQPVLDASGQPVLTQISSIERYRRTLLFQQLGLTPARSSALGGVPTQFSISTGTPGLAVNQADIGAFIGDDWRVRSNFTLSLGLRYETQTNIHDWRDLAPRVGFAWAPGAGKNPRPKLVLRGGFGIFYDRFALANTLTAERFNGVVQQQYVITNPLFFPNIPDVSMLPAGFQSNQVIQEVDRHLRAPYIIQSAFTVERQLPKNTTLAVTYTNSHGLHMFRSEDVNAPLPGTFDPNVQGSGVFPLGHSGPVFLMTSSGLYNQNQLIANVNSRFNQNVSLFGFYMLNHARSNTDGLSTFPANPYNYSGEYGPASTDIRHRVFIGGSINTKWNIRLSPFITLQSGMPFDITTGRDLYGTTLFNSRPGIATDPSKPGVIMTPYGLLDPNPTPGEPLLPRNSGRGPAQYTFNLRIAKTIGFGPEREGSRPTPQGGGGRGGRGGGPMMAGGGPGGGPGGMFGNPTTNRRYNLIISLSARNILNHNNPGPIIGNITSPLFGQANQMGSGGFGGPGGGFGGGGLPGNINFSENANQRRLELQIRFTF